jgi:hypothetical protein
MGLGVAVLGLVGGSGLLVAMPDVRRRRPSAGRPPVLRAASAQTATGSSATNLDPPEPLDSTQMRPPIRSSSSRLM